MFIVGHTLVWHSQTPRWVFQDASGAPLGRDTLLARMREHIHTVVGRYKGRIKGWDVVNEALDEDGTLRNSPWRRIIGDDYIAKAFEFAHEADPNAELYYNDYSLENAPKRNGAVALIRSLQAQGIKVSGIGLQGHNKMDWPTLPQQDSTLAAFAALGINVMITELDVDVLPSSENRNADVGLTIEARPELNPYAGGLPDSLQTALAARYADLFSVYARYRDAITRVTFWGVTDARLLAQQLADTWKDELSVTFRSRGSAEAGVRGAPGSRPGREPSFRSDRLEEDAMRDAFAPVLKESLSDRLARRIREMILGGDYQQGDRLPAIMEMARRFGVGHPTIREALKKLETMGVVEIRHGSGVYVTRREEVLVLASPDYSGAVSKKLLRRPHSRTHAAGDAVGR